MKSRNALIRASMLAKLSKRQLQTAKPPTTGGEEYEIDLITLKRRPKSKVHHATSPPPTSQQPHHTLDDIVNVKRPETIKTTKAADKEGNDLKELKMTLNKLEVSMNKKFDELEGVLKVISKDSKQSKNSLLEALRETSNTRPQRQEEDESRPIDSTTISVKRKDLESFLHNAKETKHRQDEEYFNAVRAFEASVPRLRSLEKKNFFTPINEGINVTTAVKRGIFPTIEPLAQQDNILFPTIPKREDDHIHEFMILHPNDPKPTITKVNPIGPGYHKPDLVTMIQRLGESHDKYWKLILKYEKECWTLIATEGYAENSVLIFERYVTKDELSRIKRKRWWKYAYTISLTGAGVYLLGYYLEHDSEKPLIKKTIVS